MRLASADIARFSGDLIRSSAKDHAYFHRETGEVWHHLTEELCEVAGDEELPQDEGDVPERLQQERQRMREIVQGNVWLQVARDEFEVPVWAIMRKLRLFLI